MSGWRASPSLEVCTDRLHELNILAQAAADLDQLLTAAAGLKTGTRGRGDTGTRRRGTRRHGEPGRGNTWAIQGRVRRTQGRR